MRTKWLIYILLMLAWPHTGALAATTEGDMPRLSAHSGVERPQWRDIGMCDVLAIGGSGTLTPPTTVRAAHDGPAMMGSPAASRRELHATIKAEEAAARHWSSVRGYIYLIRCLRL